MAGRRAGWIVASVGVLAMIAGCAADNEAGVAGTKTKSGDYAPLFNGKDLAGWRNYKKQDARGWEVVDGVLTRTTGKAGDLITVEEFSSFDLVFEWRIGVKGNSGVIYRCDESASQTYWTGPEYQVCDNAIEKDPSPLGKNAAGSCYALYGPAVDATRAVGEWNTSRIVVSGNHVEHYLNGKKVVEYEFGSQDWNERVAKSKFGKAASFGKLPKGHIALQDHGHKVEFREVKIKRLD